MSGHGKSVQVRVRLSSGVGRQCSACKREVVNDSGKALGLCDLEELTREREGRPSLDTPAVKTSGYVKVHIICQYCGEQEPRFQWHERVVQE